MRERILTPFFQLGAGLEASGRDDDTPGVRARDLEGTVIENGRYLLVRKVHHTSKSARFLAKDMIGGGLDVEIDLHPRADGGYEIARTVATADRTPLPDLWAVETDPRMAADAPARRTFGQSVRAAWRFVFKPAS